VKSIHLIGLAAVAALAIGCSAKKPMTKPAATPTTSAASDADQARYVVRKGDSLWAIASRSSVLGDPFRWPLLFKANRDQIVDPDFIEPRQDLSFKKSYTQTEIQDAIKKAQLTPPYEPRKQPRKVLPIQY
jgi:hypothetical protein